MALSLTASPIKTVNGIASNVNAALSQLPYTFSRQDFVVDSSADNGGFLQIVIAGVATGIVAGDRLYIGGTYDINGAATTVTPAGTTTILTNIPWVAAVGAGFCNLLSGARVDYRVVILALDAAGTDTLVDIVFRYQTLSNGSLFVDLAGLITPIFEEVAATFQYRISYQEFYNGSLQGAATLHEVVLGIIATRQQMATGGSNMAILLLGLNNAGFILNLMDLGMAWVNWRSTVTMIIDSGLDARASTMGAVFEFQPFNKSMVAVGAPVLSPISNTIGLFEYDIPEEVKTSAFVRVRGMDNTGAVSLTESYLIKTASPCNNPLMVEWLNSVGGLGQHLFMVNQEVALSSERGVVFDRPITQDSEFANNTVGRRVEKRTQSITVAAEHLTRDQFLALHEIKSSNLVVVYLDPNRERFIRVRVLSLLDSQYVTKSGGLSYSITIELEMPANFSLRDAFTNFEAIIIDADDAELIDNDDAKLITT